MKCAVGLCGHCQLGPTFVCKDGPVFAYATARPLLERTGAVTASRPGRRKPKLAVWKFASCDGCQLTLLDCEDELLALAEAVEIAHFREASRAVARGPYDLSLVEGSITTPHDAERIHEVRRASRRLVTIGACATAGGIQALRNFRDVEGVPGRGLRAPRVHRHARDLDADRRPRARSTSSSAAARSTSGSSSR